MRESEEKAHEQAKRLQAILDTAPAFILTAEGADAHAITGNSFARNLLGLGNTDTDLSKTGPQAETLRDYHVLQNGLELESNQMPLQVVAASGQGLTEHSFEIAFADKLIHLSGNVSPVLDKEGRPNGAVGVFVDVSRRKEAEKALLRNEKLASVGRMAATIAHEINNPLEVIGQAVYLARTDPGTSEQAKRYLESAAEELDRVTHITRQTLAFHHGNNKPNLIDLRESLDSVLKLYAARLDARGIEVEKRYADIERISGFGGEIRQILANLISNSMDAVQRDGRIELRLSRTRGRDTSRLVRFTIADTGSGIPPERLNEIFEPFFTTKEVIGTGLGLWVTKQIVEKHGATIRVRSTVGKGTAFSIAFPAPEHASQAA